MEGDPRNPRVSLLKKYDIPVEHLSYEYVENCSNKKELERIIRILRSGEEGNYPDLLKFTEKQLRLFAPESRVLRIETPILTKDCLSKEDWDLVEGELLSWEEEMNIMDKSLDFEKSRLEVVGNKNLPEIRKVVPTPQLKNKPEKKNKIATENSYSRIKSGDYAAWDKFDVDKELLKMDVEEERKQEENEKKKREAMKLEKEKEKKIEVEDVNKENYSLTEQQVLANQAKDRGNECYKSGDLKSALKYYGISIKLHPTANAYSNRSMTYLKLKDYENAINDGNKALSLDKNNVKALYRRATAYQNMSNNKNNDNYNQLALKDLYQIIILEPNNKVAQADLQKLKEKLNIQDSGKKFRMSISESTVNHKCDNKTENKNSAIYNKDIESIDRLPLTYYGPSTSTFQCEPRSTVHRLLSSWQGMDSSSLPGQVLCKCNSSAIRQNPLCQKCGEAMCTPKPKKAITSKEVESNTEKEKITKNQTLELKSNKTTKTDVRFSGNSNAAATREKIVNDNKYISALNSSQGLEEKKENFLRIEKKFLEAKSNQNKNNNNSVETALWMDNLTVNDRSNKSVDNTMNSLVDSKLDSNALERENIKNKITKKEILLESTISNQTKLLNNEIVTNNETKITENSSGQDDLSRNSKKSKNKKKKSKEHKESSSSALRRHLEPVKVIHASKYLHPTSVEPKIKHEPTSNVQQELNLSTNTEYKAFVPNRKCHSTECHRISPPMATAPQLDVMNAFFANKSKTNNDSSYEGNKENILENNRANSAENGKKEDDADEVKKEVVDSGYEFMKTWEELKKFDESYIKRAEILRKIKPSDLGKVIDIKLDSDMLSCILECLFRHFVETDPKRVVDLLKQLPQVPRFGLVSMFLADADKKKIKTLIEAAEKKGFKLDEEVKKNLTILT